MRDGFDAGISGNNLARSEVSFVPSTGRYKCPLIGFETSFEWSRRKERWRNLNRYFLFFPFLFFFSFYFFSLDFFPPLLLLLFLILLLLGFFFFSFLFLFFLSFFSFLLTNTDRSCLVCGEHERNNAISRTIIAFVPSNRLRVALKLKHREQAGCRFFGSF